MKLLLTLLLLVSCGKRVTEKASTSNLENRITELEQQLDAAKSAALASRGQTEILEELVNDLEERTAQLEEELCHRGKKKSCHGR